MIPELSLDKADELVQKTDYMILAQEQETTPINLGDAIQFFIEGYNYLKKQIESNAGTALIVVNLPLKNGG